MKQAQIDLISRALEEAYRALTLNDKDIAMNCIVYVQTIISETQDEDEYDARSDPDHCDHDQWLSDQDEKESQEIDDASWRE